MEQFEKIAQDDTYLAEEIIKVASEAVSDLTDEDILDEFLADLEEAGYDLQDEAVVAEIDEMLQNEPTQFGDYVTEKAAELISEDVIKVASGMTEGFETAAASKAVANYFDMHGAANFGSSFGPSAIGTGSAIPPGADARIGGGWGGLIGGGNLNPHNVNAAGKVSGVLNGGYSQNIRTASDPDEEALEEFANAIEAAAHEQNQSVDDFVRDLGYEALEAQANQYLSEN